MRCSKGLLDHLIGGEKEPVRHCEDEYTAKYLRPDLPSRAKAGGTSPAFATCECSISTPMELCCRHLVRTPYATCIFDIIVRLNSLGRSAALWSTSFAPE